MGDGAGAEEADVVGGPPLDGPPDVVSPAVGTAVGTGVGDFVGPLEGPPTGGTVVGPAVVELGVGCLKLRLDQNNAVRARFRQ